MKLSCMNLYQLNRTTGACTVCGQYGLKHMIEAREEQGYWKYDYDERHFPQVRVHNPNYLKDRIMWLYLEKKVSYAWIQRQKELTKML